MDLTELFVRVVEALEERRIEHMLIGGIAVSVWIEPRLTRDVDIVVLAGRRDASRLKQALLSAGARVTALAMRWLFEHRFVRLKVDTLKLDVHVVASSHERAALAQSQHVEQLGHQTRVARPEDLILFKLQAWRLQDQVDIQNLLKGVRGLDVRYIESWLDRIDRDTGHPMRVRWEQIRDV